MQEVITSQKPFFDLECHVIRITQTDVKQNHSEIYTME